MALDTGRLYGIERRHQHRHDGPDELETQSSVSPGFLSLAFKAKGVSKRVSGTRGPDPPFNPPQCSTV